MGVTLTKDNMDKTINITSEHILAFRRLNLCLEEFLKAGFRDEINFQRVNSDLMLGLVAERTVNDLDNLARFPTGSKKRKKCDNECTCNHDPAEIAYERYVAFVSKHSISVVARQPPADVRSIQQGRIEFILEAHGLKYPKLVLLDDENDPVVRAWNVARLNRQRAVQRVGALLFLSSQVPSGLYGDQRERLEKEGTTAMQYLFNRASDFRTSELKFAVLLGGEALALTKADILQDSFGPDMGVIQYLYPDERHPGQYQSSAAEAFKQKIHEYGSIGR
jgi:hypothetical protein